MLRKDIIIGAEQICSALDQCNIVQLVHTMSFQRDEDKTSEEYKEAHMEVLHSFQRWVLAVDKFGNAARTIMSIMELEFLLPDRSPFWTEAVYMRSRKGHLVPETLWHSVNMCADNLPRIIDLMKQDVDRYASETAKREAGDREILSVLVVEEKGFSSPARICTLMTSVQLLYQVCAQLNGPSNSDLCVISCDSGSDKSFDFLGAAKIIEQMRKTILDLWDRVVFYRERKIDAHLDIISKSLPIIEHIDSLEKNGKLGREQAGKMRRDISEGVGKFIESGAVIPEMEERSTVSPRQLMAPEPKLLVSDTQGQTSDDEGKTKRKSKKRTKKKAKRKTKEEDNKDTEEQDKTISSIVKDSDLLKNQVEKAVKEALEKERAAAEAEDNLKPEEPGQAKADPKPTG